MRSLLFIIAFLAILDLDLAAQPTSVGQPVREMARIPAGSFSPLYRNKTEPKNMKVESFFMDVAPVTNAEYLRFVIAHPEWRRSKVKRIFAEKGYLEAWENDTVLGHRVLPNGPVTSVSWFSAKAFAKWTNAQLPTILQWEYAAAQPKKGDTRANLTRLILDWYSKPNVTILPAVRSTYKNAFGIFDMHGLIWEWTSDFNSVVLSEDDRSKGKDSQMFCGSGAISGSDFDDYAAYMRYALRSSLSANSVQRNMGFRCVRNLSGK
jgi:formylglycine-generating enzyme required for sulfatase activity